MFEVSKSIKAFRLIESGESAELSKSQIVNLILNMMRARSELTRESYYNVSDLFDEYRKDKKKQIINAEQYKSITVEMLNNFNKVAPPVKAYANAEYML